jgi:hypothetical protein
VNAPFRNPAREDDLVLSHWVPKAEVPAAQAAPAAEGEQAAEDEAQAGSSSKPETQEEVPRGECRARRVDEQQARVAASFGLLRTSAVEPCAETSISPPLSHTEYKFAHFNTNSGVYSYSTEEYHQHLRDEDWTKEETDYLIDLCQAYDLRFVVIHDRWEWRGKERSIEVSDQKSGSCCTQRWEC